MSCITNSLIPMISNKQLSIRSMILQFCSNSVVQVVSICSDGLIWVKHHSHLSSHSSWGKVFGEVASDSTGISVWSHHLTPLDSVSGVIDGVLYFLNVSNSLSSVELSSSSVFAVLDGVP